MSNDCRVCGTINRYTDLVDDFQIIHGAIVSDALVDFCENKINANILALCADNMIDHQDEESIDTRDNSEGTDGYLGSVK